MFKSYFWAWNQSEKNNRFQFSSISNQGMRPLIAHRWHDLIRCEHHLLISKSHIYIIDSNIAYITKFIYYEVKTIMKLKPLWSKNQSNSGENYATVNYHVTKWRLNVFHMIHEMIHMIVM